MLAKSAIGFGLASSDKLQNNIAQLLLEECRSQSLEDAQKQFLSKIMEHVVPSIVEAVNKLEESNLRVLVEELDEESNVEYPLTATISM